LRDGVVRVLEPEHRSSMIGVSDDNLFQSQMIGLQEDDLLVLYTDGLIERRRENLDVGIARLSERVARIADSDLFAEAKSIATDLVYGKQPDDDTVVLLVRYLAPTSHPRPAVDM
jgi:serine phosphatase RsbU (regulator of sigma subunit)